MGLRIIAIGPKHDATLLSALSDYEKRLDRTHSLSWQLLPYSSGDQSIARRAESDSLRLKIKSNDIVILLDERGSQLSSEGFADMLSQKLAQGRDICFVIGGAYGVDDELRARADMVWSLSQLVFPHQLVRLLLVEQIYRAQSIANNHPYHHA